MLLICVCRSNGVIQADARLSVKETSALVNKLAELQLEIEILKREVRCCCGFLQTRLLSNVVQRATSFAHCCRDIPAGIICIVHMSI